MAESLNELPAEAGVTVEEGLPAVTVIVPVYEDAERLRLCLSALARQSYPAERVSVIVVDNGSKVAPDAGVAAPLSVRIVHEPTPGSYAARNRGLRECVTELVAFTDSDCIPDSEWIREGVGELSRHPEAGAVIGGMELFVPDQAYEAAAADFDRIFAFRHGLPRPVRHAVTANWFCFRSKMVEAGGFNEQLRSGGDSEMSGRLRAVGYPVVFVDRARVFHPTRTTVKEIISKSRRLAGGTYALAKRHRLPALGSALYLTRRLAWDMVEVLRTKVSVEGTRAALVTVLLGAYLAKLFELARLVAGKTPRRV